MAERDRYMTFGGVNLKTSYGLIYSSFEEELPQAKVITVDIPAGSDLDITEALGYVGYHNGKHKITFLLYGETQSERLTKLREIVTLVHGVRANYRLSWDGKYTFTGRGKVSVSHLTETADLITLEIDREPWKMGDVESVDVNCHTTGTLLLVGSPRFAQVRAKFLQGGTSKVGDAAAVARGVGTYTLASELNMGTTLAFTVDDWLMYVVEPNLVVNEERFGIEKEYPPTRTTSGERVTAEDSAGESPVSLSLDGSSAQGGSPTPSEPVAIDSIGSVPLHASKGGTYDSKGWPITIGLGGHEARSLPDGTHDELTVDASGNVSILQRVGAVTLDGSVMTGVTTVNGHHAAYVNASALGMDVEKVQTGNVGLCSHYVVDTGFVASRASDNTVAIAASNFSNTARLLFVDDEHATSKDAFAQWLASNPVTVLYPLANEATVDAGAVVLPSLPSPTFTAWAATTPMVPITMEYYSGTTRASAEIDSTYKVTGGNIVFDGEAAQHVTVTFYRWDH